MPGLAALRNLYRFAGSLDYFTAPDIGNELRHVIEIGQYFPGFLTRCRHPKVHIDQYFARPLLRLHHDVAVQLLDGAARQGSAAHDHGRSEERR